MHKFENIRNFRDLGHVGTVRPGVLYRSGSLNEATDYELHYLENLDIKQVIDLRVDREVNSKPDRLPNGATLVRTPLLLNGSTPGHTAVGRIRNRTAGPPKTDMTEGYFQMASQYAVAFNRAITAITHSESATLYHCQHGKDRTGVLSALILALAGTDRTLIMQDYLKTNDELGPFLDEDFIPKSAGMDDAQKEIMKSVFTAEPEYLEAFFDGIKHLAPTAADYALNITGLSNSTLKKLMDKIT